MNGQHPALMDRIQTGNEFCVIVIRPLVLLTEKYVLPGEVGLSQDNMFGGWAMDRRVRMQIRCLGDKKQSATGGGESR